MTPLTNAEKRAIWMESYEWQHPIAFASDYPAAQAEALRRYPDPKTYTISNLGECRYHNDKIEVKELGGTFHPVLRPTQDYLTFAQAINEATPPVAEPIPDPYEPKVVTAEDGHLYRIYDGHLEHCDVRYGTWSMYTPLTASDLVKLGAVAHEYSERTK